jgi:hypothetical protein
VRLQVIDAGVGVDVLAGGREEQPVHPCRGAGGGQLHVDVGARDPPTDLQVVALERRVARNLRVDALHVRTAGRILLQFQVRDARTVAQQVFADRVGEVGGFTEADEVLQHAGARVAPGAQEYAGLHQHPGGLCRRHEHQVDRSLQRHAILQRDRGAVLQKRGVQRDQAVRAQVGGTAEQRQAILLLIDRVREAADVHAGVHASWLNEGANRPLTNTRRTVSSASLNGSSGSSPMRYRAPPRPAGTPRATLRRLVYFQSSCAVVGNPRSLKASSASLRSAFTASLPASTRCICAWAWV